MRGRGSHPKRVQGFETQVLGGRRKPKTKTAYYYDIDFDKERGLWQGRRQVITDKKYQYGNKDIDRKRNTVTKEKTVAFSGHRTNRIAKFTADREKLFREVSFDTFAAIESYCIKKGYHTFLSGMCEDFDLIAAEEVLNLKKRYPHIHLKCVVPFKGQAERYTQADKRRYDTILAQADEVVTLQDGYTEGCFLRRNNYLLENSAFLMVYYDSVAIGRHVLHPQTGGRAKKKFANVCYNRR